LKDGETDQQVRQAGTQAGKHTDTQTGKDADRKIGKHADRQIGKHADRQIGSPSISTTAALHMPAEQQAHTLPWASASC